jgi:hypothetical protein
VTTFDVRTVKLRSGEQFRDVRQVELAPFELGGERYLPIPGEPEASFAMSSSSRRASSAPAFVASRTRA